jgi:hypothetical protein
MQMSGVFPITRHIMPAPRIDIVIANCYRVPNIFNLNRRSNHNLTTRWGNYTTCQ